MTEQNVNKTEDFIKYGKELIERDTRYTDVLYLTVISTENHEDELVAFHYTATDNGKRVELGLELQSPDETFPLWVRDGVEQDDQPWMFVMDIEADAGTDDTSENMTQYQVIAADGSIPFIGDINEIADEFEIELGRILKCDLMLKIKENADGITIRLHEDNILPQHQVLQMFNTYLKTSDISQINTDAILAVLGVSKLIAYNYPAQNTDSRAF